ncbi:hypothetical protein TorRG33x02_288980 [Trema orientale]|uniref:Agenet-like domain-containing protein n=1 Tax=Trema orientale TaxID=63057 RepID=A0A2P5CDV6_TREOI|nr:hypothetical protein TorRG33x02_288980 [Trema orientale]
MAISSKAYFKAGAEVEVRSTPSGVFIPVTIIAMNSSDTSFLVEYKTLKPKSNTVMKKNKGKPLMEELDLSLIRLSLPQERERKRERKRTMLTSKAKRWTHIIRKVVG